MTMKPSMAQLQSRILIGTAVLASLGLAPQVFAQQSSSLEEVVVTATKRDEMVQDIPIAVTALTQEVLETNQVVNVNDLSGLAPNMTVRPAAGGTNIPAFNMRGITSYGVVAGSDKQISIYLDGVYIGSPRGSIFSLPDIQQLEVLRGPQGTTFGRNATGGAVSITTRSPSGQLGFRQKVTSGSRDLLATETTIDTPNYGGFSAYLTYTKEEQDGDIKNLGAGTVWDRTRFGYGTDKASKTLGAKDNESVFLSVLFEPNDDFNVSYKMDYATDDGSPTGNAIVGNIFPAAIGPSGALLAGLAAVNNPNPGSNPLVYGRTRPDAVNNAYTINREQTVEGHNLTAVWNLRDDMTLKNTFGYRKVEIYSPSDLTGTSGWVVGPVGALLGGLPANTPFCYVCTQPDSEGDQWSDEIQVDYDSDFITVVAGVLYYQSSDRSGGPRNATNTQSFGFYPGYVIPTASPPPGTGQGVSTNDAKSYAGFTSAEFHITDALDVQAGLRYTYDDKDGDFVLGNSVTGFTHNPFTYDGEKFSYLLGSTYKITEDIMVYAKYSTAYVSGGSVASFAFQPETVESWEIGSKAEFLDGRLRSNIAIFDATYEHLQSAQSGANVPGAPAGIGVMNVEGGTNDVTGVEWEVTAIPLSGLTVSAGLGYQNAELSDVPALVLGTVQADPALASYIPGSGFEQTLAPAWNGNLSVNYETNPLFGTAYMTFGVTGNWHDKIRLDSNPAREARYGFAYTPESWVVNARTALKGIELGGGWEGELALWGRNLTDNDELNYITNFGAFAGGTFQEERSYGVDLVVKY